MGLIRGVARTAVIAGTATAVSNRVSRRQANRWAAKDQQQAGCAGVRGAAGSPHSSSAASATASGTRRRPTCSPSFSSLGSSKAAGVLTEEEFAAQKAKILGS